MQSRTLKRFRFSRGLHFICLSAALLASGLAYSQSPNSQRSGNFRFEAITSLDDMHHVLETNFPLGSPREIWRKAFVGQGKATLKVHPVYLGVEKYIYDIDLCEYYIWRRNISVDFDPDGHLLQAYINGEPVYSAGPQKRDVKDFLTGHQSIYRHRHRKRKRAEFQATTSFSQSGGPGAIAESK